MEIKSVHSRTPPMSWWHKEKTRWMHAGTCWSLPKKAMFQGLYDRLFIWNMWTSIVNAWLHYSWMAKRIRVRHHQLPLDRLRLRHYQLILGCHFQKVPLKWLSCPCLLPVFQDASATRWRYVILGRKSRWNSGNTTSHFFSGNSGIPMKMMIEWNKSRGYMIPSGKLT